MRLRTVSRWFFVVLVCVLLANFAFVLLIRSAYLSAEQASSRRAETMRLVNDLQHESVLLRRLVSAYTATGAPRYLLYYYDLLGIREGVKPQPVVRDPLLYWNEVIAGQRNHALPVGVAGQSIKSRMRALDFSADELAAAAEVLAVTERLKRTEQVAFAATQGLYDRKRQAYVSEGESDLAYASELVHGQAYEADYAQLSRSLSRLSLITDGRTAADSRHTADALQRYILLTLGVNAALLPALLAGMWAVRTRVLRPIDRLGTVARRLARGDYAARAGGRHQWVEELDTLGVTLNVMAHAVQDDVSQRARAQQQLSEARDLAEAATRAKSMFLANMSHEIRTPMNAIVGMTHLALQTPLTAQQRDYLQKVQSASAMLLGVINDILDFSKIEAGKLTLESAPMRVDTVVNDALVMVRQRAQEKGIELRCEFLSPGLLREQGLILGDALRLGQVLTNLLSNAVKFTETGHVTLRVAFAEWRPESAGLRIEVEDTGIGMNDAQVQQLFSEFTQADGSTTRRYGGTGLGLSITRRLVALMGGEIEVHSEPGVGSRFTLQLPVVPAKLPGQPGERPAPPAAADGAPALRLDGLRVLLVEDNPLNQQLACELLRRVGVAVTLAHHGQEALDLLKAASELPHVVLMDLQMPVMDGYQATQAMRQDPGLCALPVLAMTAHAMLEERERCLALGMQGHLSKPLEPGRLYEALLAHVPRLTPTDAAQANAPVRPAASERPHVPGLDLEVALAHVGGDPPLLAQTLLAFADHARTAHERLPALLQAAAWPELEREAHTLKGLGRTVGSEALGQAAHALERAVRQGAVDEARRQTGLVQASLANLLHTLDAQRAAWQALASAADGGEPSSDALAQLSRLVTECDGQALSLWQRQRMALAAQLPPGLFARLDDALARCDFDAAANLLREAADA